MPESTKLGTKTPGAQRKNVTPQTRKPQPSQSMNSPVDRILFLQRTIGNQAVQRLFKSGGIQAKLRIGQPNDKYEREADRVADQVMRMSEPHVQRQLEEEEKEEIQPKSLADQITPLVQRQTEEEEKEEEEPIRTKPLSEQTTPLIQRQEEEEKEEEEPLQPKPSVQRQLEEEKEEELQTQPEEEEEETLQAKENASHAPVVTPKVQANINTMRGSGKPLPKSARIFFEPRFGHNFRQVRVHNDTQAAETAKAMRAKAFTVGKDVVFGAGQYDPETSKGKKLLSHELTHVVQQGAIRKKEVEFRNRYIHKEPDLFMIQLKSGKPPPPKTVERINRIEKLIEKNWKKYVDKAKFKSPLKNRIVWHENPGELIQVKNDIAWKLAKQEVAQLSDKEKEELVKKYDHITWPEKPTFEKVKSDIELDKKQDIFVNRMGGEKVPAFYDPLTKKIHTSLDLVDVISHEALHYYSSPEFRDVFGADIDEGMTQYLAEEIERDYSYMSIAVWKEGDIQKGTIVHPRYAESRDLIKKLIRERKLEKNEVITAYFKGGKKLLRKIKKIMEKSRAIKIKVKPR